MKRDSEKSLKNSIIQNYMLHVTLGIWESNSAGMAIIILLPECHLNKNYYCRSERQLYFFQIHFIIIHFIKFTNTLILSNSFFKNLLCHIHFVKCISLEDEIAWWNFMMQLYDTIIQGVPKQEDKSKVLKQTQKV